MSHKTNLLPKYTRRRYLILQPSLNRLAAFIALPVLAFCSCGCSPSEQTPQATHSPETSYPIEQEVQSALQAHSGSPDSVASWDLGGSVVPPPAVRPTHSARSRSSSAKPQTRLASFANSPKRPIEWTFGGFDNRRIAVREIASRETASSDSAVRLVQGPALPGSGAEIVPAPKAEREVQAELVPTPQGAPERASKKQSAKTDPVARIAAEVEGSKKGTKNPSELGSAGNKKTPGQPALIDPTAERALAGAANGPEDFQQWPTPDAVLFVTGNQHGYIEPCGCTGLDKQKGGVARRYTFMNQLREKGWPLVPVDAGNQIRRIGRQASIKFEKSAGALTQMKYQAVGFGPSDMRLSAGDLIAVAYADSPENAMFVSGNLVLLDPSLLPSHKVVRQGEWKIGLTSILDPEALEAPLGTDVQISPTKESATKVLKEMNAAGANFRVLTFFGEESAAQKLMADVPGYDLIIVSGGYGEPTYQPEPIEGSSAKMIVTGAKGMYAGLVGLYQNQTMKYARVPLSHEYEDAPEMRTLMKEYQQQLEQLGLSGLGLSPIKHPSQEKFVGTEACAKCHKTAYDIWKDSAHSEATAHIVKPPKERGDIARHFDPECLSCHVTGWNAQDYQPYESGFWDLQSTAHLTGNGCENCHGPGAAHTAAEQANSGASDEEKQSLRESMRLPLEDAKEQCMTCHDLDNSPDFHEDDAFEDEYWPQVEHYGVD